MLDPRAQAKEESWERKVDSDIWVGGRLEWEARGEGGVEGEEVRFRLLF